jgi:hypothetical protein
MVVAQLVKRLPVFYATRVYCCQGTVDRNMLLLCTQGLLVPAQPPSWSTAPCRLSATAYSIYSQLPVIPGGVRTSVIRVQQTCRSDCRQFHTCTSRSEAITFYFPSSLPPAFHFSGPAPCYSIIHLLANGQIRMGFWAGHSKDMALPVSSVLFYAIHDWLCIWFLRYVFHPACLQPALRCSKSTRIVLKPCKLKFLCFWTKLGLNTWFITPIVLLYLEFFSNVFYFHNYLFSVSLKCNVTYLNL